MIIKGRVTIYDDLAPDCSRITRVLDTVYTVTIPVPRQLWHTLGMARPPAMRLTLTPAEFGRLCRMLRDWRKLRHGGVEDDIERELARKIREAGARHAEKLPADPEFTDYIA